MIRLRGFLWLLAGLVVALIAGFVAFQTLTGLVDRPLDEQGEFSGPTVDVVVAERAIPVRSVLNAEDLSIRQVSVSAVPEGTMPDIESVEGQVTLVDLFPGEVILAQRLADPNIASGDGRMALILAEDEVLMAVPAGDLLSRVGVLKPGDYVDILFSLDFPVNRGALGGTDQDDEEQATFNLLENVAIAALVGEPAVAAEEGLAEQTAGSADNRPDAVLLTVSPQDALILKYMIDADGIMTLVLRAPGVERPSESDPVDVDFLINRYDIPTEVGR